MGPEWGACGLIEFHWNKNRPKNRWRRLAKEKTIEEKSRMKKKGEKEGKKRETMLKGKKMQKCCGGTPAFTLAALMARARRGEDVERALEKLLKGASKVLRAGGAFFFSLKTPGGTNERGRRGAIGSGPGSDWRPKRTQSFEKKKKKRGKITKAQKRL